MRRPNENPVRRAIDSVCSKGVIKECSSNPAYLAVAGQQRRNSNKDNVHSYRFIDREKEDY